MWGMDLVGPFPQVRGQAKYILVAVGYFTKCIEEETLATIRATKVKGFYWWKLVCRFGLATVIVSDNECNLRVASSNNYVES